jgi:tryptophan synthase beta subunit
MNSYQHPDPSGHFGPYGGSFVSETLTHAIQELREAYARYQNDPEFLAEFTTNSSISWAAPRRSTTLRAPAAKWAARRFTSSAKTSTTPARTRSTT